jgi:hypothetical protein
MSEANFYSVGINNVGSYQVSGYPFVTGSVDCSSGATKIEFPKITRWVKIQAFGNECKVGFSQAGVENDNYFTLASGQETEILELKLSELWVSGSTDGTVNVLAGLTNIRSNQMSNLTGVGIDE